MDEFFIQAEEQLTTHYLEITQHTNHFIRAQNMTVMVGGRGQSRTRTCYQHCQEERKIPEGCRPESEEKVDQTEQSKEHEQDQERAGILEEPKEAF